MRPGPATRAASYVDSWSSLSTHGGGMTAPARQRSKPYRVPHLLKPVADPSSRDHASTPRGWPAALSRSLLRRARSEERSGGGGRNAQATSSRSRTFLDFPRQFTLENHRLPLALPQSFGKPRNSHVSMHPLSRGSSGLATQKICFVVKKLWRTYIPCGSPRKT
jgi:hypothetical protein